MQVCCLGGVLEGPDCVSGPIKGLVLFNTVIEVPDTFTCRSAKLMMKGI